MDLFGAGPNENNKDAKDRNKLAAEWWFFKHSDVEWWFDMAGYNFDKAILKIRDWYIKYQFERPELIKRLKNKLKREADGIYMEHSPHTPDAWDDKEEWRLARNEYYRKYNRQKNKVARGDVTM